MYSIDNKKADIAALCSRHKVGKLYLFGSALTNRFNNDSDIDLLVDFNKEEISDYFDNFFELKYALEALFGRSVDLVEEKNVRNPYFKKSIDSSKVMIYGW